MRRLTRLASLCLSLVLLQLVLVEGGFACRADVIMAGTGMPMSATAGMQMPAGQSQAPQTTRDHGDNHRPPCRFPWAPDGCQSMAPCAPAALVSAPISLPRRVVAPASAPALIVLPPASLSRPPELPPPRA